MAMAKASISVSSSRFAVLKVEDEDDDSTTQNTTIKQTSKSNTQNASSKKKNKKKKKHDPINTEVEKELKHMAFCKPVKVHKESDKAVSQKPDPKQWMEWQEKDEEFTQESYQKDLEQALLQSKQEYERQVQKVKENFAMNGIEGKKKKKKDKQPVMTLEQFNQMEFKKEKSLNSDDDSPEPVGKTPVIKTSFEEADSHFFEKVSDDVTKIISREKVQEEYKKHYAMESAVMLKCQQELTKKDREIEELKSELSALQEEFKQVKKRNKQLCVILAQGEMKDKAQVLMHVEDLTQVRDELTEQVSELNAELEKEKSKVHALKVEIEKLKGGKHHGK